jgi:hypothetical protein
MSKWTDERSWRVSMYIGYVLCFIILSVAGYNGIMMLVGDVTLFMRVVLLICVCLFVAFGVFLFFSVVITPFSEILNRLAVYLFKKMKMHSIPVQTTEVEMEVNDESITDDADDEHQEISASADGRDKKEELRDDSAHETLKAEFMSEYVRYDHQKDTIYEVFEVLFLEKKSGAFAAHAFKCAMDEKWLKCFPGYEAAKRLFPKEDSIKGGKSNYSNANNNKLSPAKEEEIRTILLDKFNELNPQKKDGQE